MGWVLRYAFTENSKREKAYQDLIKSDISDIQEDVRKHDERMAKALSKFEQVHIYQREEHNRMIEVLNKMSDKLSSIRSIEVKA